MSEFKYTLEEGIGEKTGEAKHKPYKHKASKQQSVIKMLFTKAKSFQARETRQLISFRQMMSATSNIL